MNQNNNPHQTLKKVLIIENNPTTRAVLTRMIKEIGYTPITAENGEEAKSRLALNQFDLCLLDLNLPDITGQRLCQYIRARTTIPLIVLSAEDNVDVIVNLLELGADDYIVKPADFSVIKVTIQAQIRRAASVKPSAGQRGIVDPFAQLFLFNTRTSKKSKLH